MLILTKASQQRQNIVGIQKKWIAYQAFDVE